MMLRRPMMPPPFAEPDAPVANPKLSMGAQLVEGSSCFMIASPWFRRCSANRGPSLVEITPIRSIDPILSVLQDCRPIAVRTEGVAWVKVRCQHGLGVWIVR